MRIKGYIIIVFVCSLYWISDSLWSFFSFEMNIKQLIFREPASYIDTFLLRVSPYQILSRLIVVGLFGIIGVLIVEFIIRKSESDRKIRESEEKFRLYTENSLDLIYQIDQDGIIAYCSPSVIYVLGYQPHELIGTNLVDYITEDSFHHAVDKLNRVKNGESLNRLDLQLKKKNGLSIYAEINAVPILQNGKVVSIHGIIRDTTSRIELERQRHLIQKQKSISTLAGGIAHDFNNMLGVITGNISYALSQVDQDDELHDVLRDVQEGTKQAQSLTQQLLTFAKGGEPVKKVIALNQLIKDASGLVTRGAKSKCEYHLAKDLCRVEADAGQLQQVISNLVINADQAMPDGGIISIQTENFEAEPENDFHLTAGYYVKISIEDQGIGIQDKYLTQIFDPYFTTKQNGNGLGLATTYSIIKRHGGHIMVDSETGKGTVFHIYLSADFGSLNESSKKSKQTHMGHGKILIMDDQVPILNMLERILNRMGYDTECALDGSEAVHKYHFACKSQKPFDIVILDLTVPGGMGGTETMQELLKINPDIKAIVSSGYSNDSIMANYKNYGFCGVMPKPYTKIQLSEVLNKISPSK